MANTTASEVARAKQNRELSEPGDWELFFEKIAEYNRNQDLSRHEIKLSGKRTMAIYKCGSAWQASIYR